MTAEHAPPTVSIGLPVYNGEDYLRESLDALLAQTYTDFELIISDNASTDATAEICREYAERDPRIRYVRQEANIGAAPNHNVPAALARGRYFKWASDDDLYRPELLAKCVEAIEQRPYHVLAHAWDAVIDQHGKVVLETPYVLETDSPDPARRLRSLLVEPGGNDYYGVIRTDVLRRVLPYGSYPNSDRTLVAALALHGPFYQVPEVLYLRRDHPGRATRVGDWRAKAAILDPRYADRLRYPLVRIYVEYVMGFVTGIWRAPLTGTQRLRCYGEVARWFVSLFTTRRNRTSVEDQVQLS